MLACGAEGHAANLGPLESAAHVLNEMQVAGTQNFIIKKIMGEMLGMEIETDNELR